MELDRLEYNRLEYSRLVYNNEFIEKRLEFIKDVIKFVDFFYKEVSFFCNSCLKNYFIIIRINIKFYRISLNFYLKIL